MNMDFHYYGTYVAARVAGFDRGEAILISRADQYVDDSDASKIHSKLKDVLKETPQQTTMAYTDYLKYYVDGPTKKWTNAQLSDVRKVWMTFHFIPSVDGSEYLNKSKGDIERKNIKYMCLPNTPTVKYMVNKAISDYRINKDLHRIGLTMHVLEDTWAHMYYIGRPDAEINDAGDKVYEVHDVNDSSKDKELDFNIIKSGGLTLVSGDKPKEGQYFALGKMIHNDSIAYLGHGRMGHIPDYSYICYDYYPKWTTRKVRKNNIEAFMNAFRQAVYALTCVRTGQHFDVHTYADNKKINNIDIFAEVDKIFRTRNVDNSEVWKKLIKAMDGLDIDKYNKDEWYNEFNDKHKNGKNEELIKTHYYLFNKAAIDHRNSIQEFLVTNNLSLNEL